MNIKKLKLKELNRAYATACLSIDHKDYILYASESTVGVPGFAYAYNLDDIEHPEIVWNNAGGCMGIIQHPFKQNCFLAVQEFYLKENPSKAKIVEGNRKNDGTWEIKDIVHLPLVHRIGILRDNENAYLIACTVARQKDDKDDWSKPGEIWGGKISKDQNKPFHLSLLKTGLFKNHGFYQYKDNDKDKICIGTDYGAYIIYIDNKEIRIKKILDGHIGEVALHDINQDGKLELITIEPFHGNKIHIYQENKQGIYEPIWTYQNEIEFAHALTGGSLLGKECFIAGVRKGKGEVFTVFYKNGNYETYEIDQGVGPTNLCIIHHKNKDYISCANHTIHECALYEIKK